MTPEQLTGDYGFRLVKEVLVISGPCGAGKSSVGFECLELLEEGGVAAAMIDAELAYFHPKPEEDPQGTRVAERALAALAPIYESAGIGRLLLPRVVERRRHLELVHAALPGARFQVVWLQVSAETIAERLAVREIGSGLEWHLQRAEEIRRNALEQDLFDFVVDGERPVRDVSLEVLRLAGWH
jgi:GNAT superfamily N-acetyltransferase